MAGKYAQPKRRRRRKRQESASLVHFLLAAALILIVLSLGIRLLLSDNTEVEMSDVQLPSETISGEPAEQKLSFWDRLFGHSDSEQETEPEPVHVTSKATVAVTGDILMHLPVINTGLQSDGAYSFDSIFQYILPITQDADYAVANLETTLAGNTAGYKYSGYPAFNCPDAIVDALKTAGFDALLTANNHCYDTSEYGFLRTVNTIRGKGLTAMGTQAAAGDSKYTVADINDIRIGMVCYTYEGRPDEPVEGVTYMNKNALSATCAALINSFLSENIDAFYAEAAAILEEMRADGAEASVIFIHWGTEYQTVPSAQQEEIAQQLCDIGFDVIVGGHPHVIQPMALLTSRTDAEHKTVCLYSTGNAVSNQRIAEMDLKTGHTEDGLLFSFTFVKYSDGTVYLQNADILPCWVDLRTADSGKQYVIIPLDITQRDQWQELYALTDEALENASESYDRTVALTGSGLADVQDWLAESSSSREDAYLTGVGMNSEAA